MISPAISESPITRKREGPGGREEERGNPRDIIIVSYPRHKLAVKYRETIRMLASVLYAFQQEALGTSSEDIPRQRSNNAAISFSTEEAYRTMDRIGAWFQAKYKRLVPFSNERAYSSCRFTKSRVSRFLSRNHRSESTSRASLVFLRIPISLVLPFASFPFRTVILV